jgi:V/A-type H+/Na+-transporting ATPase subunit C
MSSDFGYINARIKGLSSKLLGTEFFNQALNDSSFQAFTSTLGQTGYVRDVEEAQSRYSGLTLVDKALGTNFYRTMQSILGFSDGKAGELIALLLMRYDLANLKTIVRAKHAGRSSEDIGQALLPAGQLKPAVLDTLAAANDVPAVAQAFGVTRHPLSTVFGRAARKYASDGNLYDLELALDKGYYTALVEGLEGADAPKDLLRHTRREIDATNLRTALKLRGQSVNNEEMFIRGGKEMTRTFFDNIIADKSQGALAPLATTSFAKVAETTSLSEAENVIRDVLDQSARRLSFKDPLDIGVVLSFLRRKEAESAKLRLLARGKFYNVPKDRLAKELGNA